MEINMGQLKMPINSATKTFGIIAKRGAGKTYTAGVLAEEFYKNGIPFIVFDPIDVWWGLRYAKDGKAVGLPVVVFGIEHADIQLTKDMGRDIARAIVRDNICAVISTFGMPKNQQRQLITDFSEELLNINNTPRHVFIEEAHEFVPQRVWGGLGKCFNAVSNLVVMGRNRGIGVSLINQRAATLNKDVMSQVDTLIVLRSIGPQDRKALEGWVEAHSAEGDFDKFMNSLPSLPTGEAWIWSPEFLSIFERVKIRERDTFHPDREKLGSKFAEMPLTSQINVQEFIDKFKQSAPQPSKKEEGKKDIGHPQIEQPLLKAELQALRNQYESQLLEKDVEIRRLRGIIDNARRSLGVEGGSNQAAPIASSNLSMWLGKLGKGGTSRILRFLAEKSGLKFSRSQIGLAVGLSGKSGSFNTYMATLKRNGLILEEGGFCRINPDL